MCESARAGIPDRLDFHLDFIHCVWVLCVSNAHRFSLVLQLTNESKAIYQYIIIYMPLCISSVLMDIKHSCCEDRMHVSSWKGSLDKQSTFHHIGLAIGHKPRVSVHVSSISVA